MVAHTLKSSSASVGALALSALCAEVERELRDGDDDAPGGTAGRAGRRGRARARCRATRPDAAAMSSDSSAFADDDSAERPRVLLVDDDEVNLMLTAIALRERGFDIVEVTDGDGGAGRARRMRARHGRARCADARAWTASRPARPCARCRGYAQMPVLMLTGLDDDASITRAYRAGATDFFVKSTQWSLLAGRLRYMLRASRTRIELERSKFKLARAQDLARMGSFDWRRGERLRPALAVARGAACVRQEHRRHGSQVRGLLRMVGATQRRGLMRMLSEVVAHNAVLATDVSVTLFDGRQRVVHVEAEAEFEHGHAIGYTGVVPGRDRPPRRRGPHPPPGQLRCADRPAEPAPADLAHRARTRACAPARPRRRAAADRPRPLQERQRHARPRRRRRTADGSGAAPARLRAPQRPGDGGRARSGRRALAPHARSGRPAGRRRVRRAAARGHRRAATPSASPAASSTRCANRSSWPARSASSPPASASRCSRATA